MKGDLPNITKSEVAGFNPGLPIPNAIHLLEQNSMLSITKSYHSLQILLRAKASNHTIFPLKLLQDPQGR